MDDIFRGCVTFLLYGLGRTGALVRIGINTKSALNKARLDAKLQGRQVTSSWYKANRKATLYIIAPILGWTILYFVIFRLLSKTNAPTGIYILILLPIIPVLVGVLGWVFKPMEDEEIDDYIPIFDEERKAQRTKELVSEIVNKLNIFFVAGDPEAIKDQIALLSLVDDLIKNNHRINPKEIPKIRNTLLKQANEKVFTHLINLLSEKDQKELNIFLDDIPSNKEMWQFFARKIPKLETQIGNAFLQFRDSYLAEVRK